MKAFYLLPLLLLLTSCGSKLSGEYGDKNEMITYTFKSGNKVYIKALGMETEGKYEVDDNKVKVESNGQNVIYTIKEDGSIDTPFGLLTKK